MNRFLISFVSIYLLVFVSSLNGQEPLSRIHCGQMLDIKNSLVRNNVMISIDQGSGKIKSLEFDYSKTDYDDIDTLNLSNYFCLPGLIDMHTHISEDHYRPLVDYLTMTQLEQIAIGRGLVKKTLLAGFTSVRDLGVYIAWTDKLLRDEINAGLTDGPRMQISGFYLTIPGGGGDIDVPGYTGNVPAHIRQV